MLNIRTICYFFVGSLYWNSWQKKSFFYHTLFILLHAQKHYKITWGHNQKWWPGDLRIYTMYNACVFTSSCCAQNSCLCCFNDSIVVVPSLQHDIYCKNVHSRHFMCLIYCFTERMLKSFCYHNRSIKCKKKRPTGIDVLY